MDKKQAILVVSFGTSYIDNLKKTIGAVECAIDMAFPEYVVYRAFTSQRIIDKLKKAENLSIDNVKEALDRAESDGIRELIVQPTHFMNGFEYMDIKAEVEANKNRFSSISLGKPLLADETDIDAVIEVLADVMKEYDDGKTAICLMGHGTEADSNIIYSKMQERFKSKGYENYYIGTVEAKPDIKEVIARLNAKGSYRKAVLHPLMVVAGDHANNDMAGDDDDSWKSQLERAGYEVECILRGLGQMEAIHKIYAEHVMNARENIQ